MTEVVRCKTCVMPNTRPDTPFIDGECSACVSYRKRKTIDWEARADRLEEILADTWNNGSGYNCIVPSSGGKDSHYQVLRLIELGARPLVVTATTCHLTEIGRRNIDNLARYATTIEVSPNKEVRRKLNRLGLELVGDISWPEHASIFSTPFRIACDLGIPLIFYGENPQEAYGGPIGTDEAAQMTRRWVSEFGGFLGLRPSDFVGKDGITWSHMQDYCMPSLEQLDKVRPTAYFLGHFEEWDSHRNAKVARKHGMEQRLPSVSNWWDHENLDNAQTGIHDHFMFLKYGFGRGCQQISVDVRMGLVSRKEALDWIEEQDGLFPGNYCGIPYWEVLKQIGMTKDQFDTIVKRFTR